jgi:cation transport ATPase
MFVDVDDTLIRSVGSRRIPMPAVIDRVRALSSEGVVLYLWSSGGAEYAEACAAELGLKACFAGFLPKPDAYLDDQRSMSGSTAAMFCQETHIWLKLR